MNNVNVISLCYRPRGVFGFIIFVMQTLPLSSFLLRSLPRCTESFAFLREIEIQFEFCKFGVKFNRDGLNGPTDDDLLQTWISRSSPLPEIKVCNYLMPEKVHYYTQRLRRGEENKNRIKDGNREQHLNLEQVAGHRIAYFTPLLLIQMEIIVLLLWLHLPGDFLEHIERRTRRKGIKEEKEQQKAPQMFWDWIYLADAASDADRLADSSLGFNCSTLAYSQLQISSKILRCNQRLD